MSVKRLTIYLTGGIILGVGMQRIGVSPEIVIVPVCLYMAFGIWFLGFK